MDEPGKRAAEEPHGPHGDEPSPANGRTARVEDARTRELIQRVQAGERAAWDQLHERYRRTLLLLHRGKVPSKLRGRMDTEDLVSSTLVAVVREIQGFRDRGPGSFHAWVTRILENKLYGALRAQQADKRDARREEPYSESVGSPPAGSPSQQVAHAEELARLLEHIADLPEPGRTLIERCRLDGVPLTRVAAELGMPETTARRLHDKCFRRLARRLEEDPVGGD